MQLTPDLGSFLHQLPPGSHVVLAFVTLERDGMLARPSTASAGGAMPLGLETLQPKLSLVAGGAAAAGAVHAPYNGYRWALTRLEAEWEHVRDHVRPVAQWAKHLRLSERELRRAIDQQALPASQKTNGRNHGAWLVGAADIRVFIQTVVAVESNSIESPTWWHAVRRRSA